MAAILPVTAQALPALHRYHVKKLLSFKFPSLKAQKRVSLKEPGSFADFRQNPHPALVLGLPTAGALAGPGGVPSAELDGPSGTDLCPAQSGHQSLSNMERGTWEGDSKGVYLRNSGSKISGTLWTVSHLK